MTSLYFFTRLFCLDCVPKSKMAENWKLYNKIFTGNEFLPIGTFAEIGFWFFYEV